MELHIIDISIVLLYLAVSIGLGFWVAKLSSGSLSNYFLAGNKLPWYTLGLSNASGMFDVAGTMWMVGLLVVYGVKSIYFPWMWPVFNQIFLMVFLSIWLRRSGKLTGAEWINFRFGEDKGAKASHMINIIFALITVVGSIAFSFLGIGKLAAEFSPIRFSNDILLNDKIYGVIIVALTTIYSVKGGMYSVVVTEVLQFYIKLVVCLAIGYIAFTTVSHEMLAAAVPDGWEKISFGNMLNLDWGAVAGAATPENQIVATSAQKTIEKEGHSWFSIFVGLMLFQGVFKSMAGPVPNYDMQRILSTKSPVEAAKMSAVVNVVLLFPRYLMITGLAVLAVVFIGPEWTRLANEAAANGKEFTGDFDAILPFAINKFIPIGLLGLTLAGLLSAFMASYSASLNAAPAYIVNDIYKKYINPNASQKKYVNLSYIVSISFAVIGTIIGWQLTSLNDIVAWLATGLFGGYTAANFVKWFWWRLNGTGYFLSMALGVAIALAMPIFKINELQAFPLVFLICIIVAVVGSYLTPATDIEVLKEFYFKTRPWGFWSPIYDALIQDGKIITKNNDMGRDLFNVLVGIIWQTAITASAIFLIIKEFMPFYLSMVIVIITTLLLKKYWWNNLKDDPDEIIEKT